MYCPNCSKKVPDTAKFCPKCGYNFVSTSKKAKVSEKKEEIIKKPFNFIPIVAVICIVIVVGIIYFYLRPSNPSTSILNSSSHAAVNNSVFTPECTTTSQCASGDYCNNIGICTKISCGDGVCSPSERQSNSCAIDCGCSGGTVLNSHTNQCQAPINVSTQLITQAVENYLKTNSINGTISSMNNTYYGNQTVKEAVVNCQAPKGSVCQIIFYLNSNATIIQIFQTD